MADSNMDFENKADLVEEDPPPILSNEIREVFYLFASMLDIKSFMKLTMASKTMYKRCMEDRMIKIKLEEKEVSVSVENGVRTFSFHSFDIFDNRIEKYLETLRQLKCNVSLKRIRFEGPDADVNNIMETRRYLDELGVKTIENLKIVREYNVLNPISFIKDYNLKNVEIRCKLPDDVINALLQLELDSLSYYGSEIKGEILLDVVSPIPQLKFSMEPPSADVFTQILSRIQTGDLKKLAIRRIPWNSFTSVQHDHDGPLPDERPLLISDGPFGINWFLHWDGAVTKSRGGAFCEFSKCDQDDLPPVLQSKEMIHKALAEKRDTVDCLKSHFTSFFDGIPVLDASHKGPFPEERPLLCVNTHSDDDSDPDEDYESYYLLNVDGSIDSYFWYGHVECDGTYDMKEQWPETVVYHIPLLKYVIKTRIEEYSKEGYFDCKSFDQFRSLFEDFETLPDDFEGELPESRPLVFENTLFTEDENIEEEQRIVLYEDGSLILFECSASHNVHIQPCPSWNLPVMMMLSQENLNEIILEAPFNEFTYTVDYDMFCDAFDGIKTISVHAFGDLPTERPLVFKSAGLEGDEILDHRWLLLEDGNVRKCEWEEGEAKFSRANPKEFPFILTKALVTNFFEGRVVNTDLGFFIERDVLNQCLENCCRHSYDERKTSLFSESRPLIFEKTEVKHICEENTKSGCTCVDEILHLCFVDEDEDVIHITWENRFLSFNKNPKPDDLPQILKTKEYLEYLLQAPWNSGERKKKWYGSSEDFVSYIKSRRVVDFNHEGRLPKTRPLVFEKKDSNERSVYWFFRKDCVLIKCETKDSHILLTVNPEYGHPPAVSSSS